MFDFKKIGKEVEELTRHLDDHPRVQAVSQKLLANLTGLESGPLVGVTRTNFLDDLLEEASTQVVKGLGPRFTEPDRVLTTRFLKKVVEKLENFKLPSDRG